MSYHQFTSEERFCLWRLLEKGYSIRAISRAMDRAPSTISRELKRNKSKKGTYNPLPAQRKANQRRRHLRNSSLHEDAELKEYVITHLKQFWPPAAIAGRWTLENPDRTFRVLQRPSPGYGRRRPELLQVCNDVFLKLRILLERGIAKMSPPLARFPLSRKRMVIAFLTFVSLQFPRDRRRSSAYCT